MALYTLTITLVVTDDEARELLDAVEDVVYTDHDPAGVMIEMEVR